MGDLLSGWTGVVAGVLLGLLTLWVVRAAGPDALARHWQGSPEGYEVVRRLAGTRA